MEIQLGLSDLELCQAYESREEEAPDSGVISRTAAGHGLLKLVLTRSGAVYHLETILAFIAV